MSSKLSNKPSRKDRPKSTDKLKGVKKRDGTPEKATSPNLSQSQMEDDLPPSKQVINGEDIQALAIDSDKLREVHIPKPPSAERRRTPTKPVMVRKHKPKSEIEKPKTKRITIAKPAPPDAPLKPVDYTGSAGPRFDIHGNIIPHSILGSVEEFKAEALRQGHLANYPEAKEIDLRPRTPSVKFEKKKRSSAVPPQNPLLDENNALKNWQQKMLDRKKQQGYISKLLQKPVEHLVMNQAEEYRKIQEERYLIDRSIPAVDYGKGYRVGSEFWKQVEKVGDDLTGIQMTLLQTERGYPPPIEHIGNPHVVQKEKGTTWQCGRSTPVNYPWKKSQYLHHRKQQIEQVMNELDPHKPEMDNLQVVGSNRPVRLNEDDEQESLQDATITEMPEEDNLDPLRDQPDIPHQVIGPALLFDGFPARWTGDSCTHKDDIAHNARVTFEAFAGERITSCLQLVNDGTTTIYYDWKLIPKSNPLETVLSGNVQRFYFNTSSGVLLPGDTLRFPFVFKSPNAGIFSETWQLITRPAVHGGAALKVTLRGVALQEDKNKKVRNEIERELAHKQAQMAIKRIVDDLVEGIRTPERARSPIDAYITDEQVFERLNPGMHYTNEIVCELRQLYLEQFSEEEREEQQWDLSLSNMKQMFLEIEDDEKREDLLMKMNTAAITLRFPPFSPVQQQMYKVGYQCWLETVDGIVGQSMLLRNALGMKDREDVYPENETILAVLEAMRGEPKKKKKEHKEEESKKDKKDAGKKGKKDQEKEKDRPKSKGKASKPASRAAPTPTQGVGNKDLQAALSDRADLRSSQLALDATPVSETGDPVLDNKYRTKLYVQVYGLLGDMVTNMVTMFEDIKSYEDDRALSGTK